MSEGYLKGTLFGDGNISLSKVCIVNTRSYTTFCEAMFEGSSNPQTFWALCVYAQEISNCFIIDRTSMAFTRFPSNISYSYYVGPTTADLYNGRREETPPIPAGSWSPFSTGSASFCYMHITEGTVSGSGTQVTEEEMRDIHTFLPEWDIAPGITRTDEIWAIGEIPEQSDDILVVTFSKTYTDDRYNNPDCYIYTESNQYTPTHIKTRINDDKYEVYFYFSIDVFEGKSQNDITIVGIAATNSLEPEGWEHWMNYCATTYPDQSQGGALVELAMRAEAHRTINVNEIPIMISIPPLSGPYCIYAE